MACLPQTKLLRALGLSAPLILAALIAPAHAQITEAEINALFDPGRIAQDDSNIEALVSQAEEAQQRALEEAQEAVEEGVSIEQALRDEYGIELRPDQGEAVNDPSLYIFVSFSMPDSLIREYLQDALRYGGRVVVRGLIDGSIPETQKKLSSLIEADESRRIGASVDPRAFEAFDVQTVPAIAVSERPVTRCDTEDCVVQAGTHDIIYGSVSVEYALEQFVKSGDASAKARRHLNGDV